MAEKYSCLKFVRVRWKLERKAGLQRKFPDATYSWLAGCLEYGDVVTEEKKSKKGKIDCTRDRKGAK